MVEFGLKLEDNKTSKWAHHYIAYEQLKNLLKKAKQARQAKIAIEEKHPNLAHSIPPPPNPPATFAAASMPNLTDIEAINYGSVSSSNIVASAPLSPSTLSRVTRAINPMSLFQTDVSTLVAKHAKAAALAALRADEFGAALKAEITKVDNFYLKKFNDMASRVEGTEEEVVASMAQKRYDSAMTDTGDSVGEKKVSPARRRKTGIVLLKRSGSETDKESSSTSLLYNSDSEDEAGGSYGTNIAVTDTSDIDIESKGNSNSTVRVSRNSLSGSAKFNKLAESDSIKRALIDMSRTLKLLSNFAVMNYTGFVKILKKHDKTLPEHKSDYKHLLSVNGGPSFKTPKLCDDLNDHLEKLFATWFTDNSVHQARAQMFRKVGDGLEMDWTSIRLGYRLGMCAVLAIWLCWDCMWQTLVPNGNTINRFAYTIGSTTAFPVFRACGGLLLLNWCWGVSTFVWSRFRINYIYLFEFDPRFVSTPLAIFGDCVDHTLVFLTIMLLYYKSGLKQIPHFFPSGVYPFVLVMYTLNKLLFPWKTRKPLFLAIQNVVLSPLHSSTFFTQYVADVFTSLIKVFQDWCWTICYVLSGDFLNHEAVLAKQLTEKTRWQNSFTYVNVIIPLICLLPIWFRFMQCLRRFYDTRKRWPNLANALKYTLSQTITLFGAFHPLYLYNKGERESIGDDFNAPVGWKVDVYQYFWIGLFVVSSIYSFLWDIFMDWGLGRREYGYLGPRLMFPNKNAYYFSMVADGVLRCLWVSSLLPPNSGSAFIVPNYLTAMVLSLEIVRRTVWGFFRLEKEHRANTEGYRRVDFVPLHFNTGHKHDYKEKHEKGGTVLTEIIFVSLFVVIISISSIIAARTSND